MPRAAGPRPPAQTITAASGTLTFATGESSKTVNVTVLDDAHDDNGETLDLVLSNVTGATIADGTGTGDH